MMSSLRNILNPEEGRRRSVKLIVNMDRASTSEMPSSTGTSPVSDASENVVAETVEDPTSKDHESHPDCPDSLACLPDTDGRPQHTLPVILRCAILGSPRKRLTIREIYAAMEAKYSYYKTAGPTWKQSVRHHLSLNRLFERQPRPVTDPGFGSYWTVNLTAPPGTKRPRKRGRQSKEAADGSPLPPKKRGRPRKILPPIDTDELQKFEPPDEDEDKNDSRIGPVASTSTHGQKEPVQRDRDHGGDKQEYEEDQDAGYGSEDDYESEEEVIHPMDRRNSLIGLSGYAPSRSTQPYSLPPFSTLRNGASTDSIIDSMQAEIAGLRRQSAEAVSLSLRLSEQLVHAQAESSRTRAALRTIERMLEDESKRRREAEKAIDNEEKRRRKAEEALNELLAQSPASSNADQPIPP
ncbi:hypothetical protein D9615_001197 [Tricholomella constricta]|uniref:Fork-head domain-containing protein n=1 Tax=Tricholomella constricta TaxID=117010 RepID=A0A8H5HLF1_9AGAR|nr:hypothetical protein D9615_001197 [Tricholomella constricta]